MTKWTYRVVPAPSKKEVTGRGQWVGRLTKPAQVRLRTGQAIRPVAKSTRSRYLRAVLGQLSGKRPTGR